MALARRGRQRMRPDADHSTRHSKGARDYQRTSGAGGGEAIGRAAGREETQLQEWLGNRSGTRMAREDDLSEGGVGWTQHNAGFLIVFLSRRGDLMICLSARTDFSLAY